jgi:predicted Zn-dependent protease
MELPTEKPGSRFAQHDAEYFVALSLRSQGNPSQALAKLQALAQDFPDDGRLWELIGLVATEAQEGVLALRALERASALVPLTGESQLLLARGYERSGQRDLALDMYRFLAGRCESESFLLEPLASALGRCGDPETALRVCRIAAMRTPHDARPLMGIVHYMRRLKKPVAQVLPAAYRAHQLDPDNAECRITLAWMLHEIGRSEEGAEILADVACEEFSCIRCLTLMQRIFAHVGDEENASVCRNRLMVLAADVRPNDFGQPESHDL